MRKFHLIFGVVVLIVFALTGQYMHWFYNHLYGMENFPRILFRSRHIYILLAGLVNVGIGIYFNYWYARWRKRLQIIGSVLILLSPVFLIAAFFYETAHVTFDTPFSRLGLFSIFGGVLLHLIAGWGTVK
jgi:hypothetical protein